VCERWKIRHVSNTAWIFLLSITMAFGISDIGLFSQNMYFIIE
jgi:hypothetical protein